MPLVPLYEIETDIIRVIYTEKLPDLSDKGRNTLLKELICVVLEMFLNETPGVN